MGTVATVLEGLVLDFMSSLMTEAKGMGPEMHFLPWWPDPLHAGDRPKSGRLERAPFQAASYKACLRAAGTNCPLQSGNVYKSAIDRTYKYYHTFLTNVVE